jgi:peptidoglycan hydrolase CwlO-like protein
MFPTPRMHHLWQQARCVGLHFRPGATKRSAIVTVEECRTTIRGLCCRVRLAGVATGLVGLTLVTGITATVVVPPGPVAADQVTNLKAKAAQIAQDLVLEQLQIGTYQQQYDVDGAKVQGDEVKIRLSEKQIRDDLNRMNRDHKRLQAEAVSAYINLYPQLDGSMAGMFEGNQNQRLARGVYERVASGDIALTIDALHTDENELHAERATLEQQEAQDQATTNQQATLLRASRQTGVELESKQSEITGELAAAVAQQQAEEAAAAAAAVRAAQAAAATAATSRPSLITTTPQPATSSTPSTAQGNGGGASSGNPSLPPFLQCVLQVESGGNYAAVSPGGTYMGGFQFSQPTWNEAAQLAGMPQLINVHPNVATPAEQNDLAIALYDADGEQPWNDSCQTK